MVTSIAVVATVTSFTVRQSEVTKTAHLTALKDILQFTSGGHVLGFAKSGVYVANGSHALRVEFVNAHSTTPLSTTSPSETGNTKAAPPLSQVTYQNLWDGVTLTYDAPSGAVARSTYRLDPYAKSDNIRLRYNAPVSVQRDGSLRVNFKTGPLNESAPQAWQERGGKRVPVQIAFAPRGKDEITFTTGHYDRSQSLFIDPTLTWNTFLGGSGDDEGFALAVDVSGNVYVAGLSTATWGSPVNAFSGGGADGFAAKLDSTGNLTWNTFLGGSGVDICQAVAVDGSGDVYVAGYSDGTWGSPGRAFSGGADAFAAKLDSNGNLIWNNFLGGDGNEAGQALAVDGSGNVYVAGYSNATWGSPVNAFSGVVDIFVAKINNGPNYSAQIQPPINADGTSVFSVRRGVVPVRFTLTQDGNRTCALPPATIAVTRTSGGTTGAINESDYVMAADNGSNFRIDGCQYMYNLSSGALGPGTYRVDIKINGQAVGSGVFQLK